MSKSHFARFVLLTLVSAVTITVILSSLGMVESMLALNGRMLIALLRAFSVPVRLDANPSMVIEVLLFVIEAWLAVMVVSMQLRRLWVTSEGSDLLRDVVLLLAVVSSLWMTAYLYSIFYGDVVVLGTLIMRFNTNAEPDFFVGTSLGGIAMVYLFSQLLPFAYNLRNVYWTGLNFITSLIPTGIMTTVLFGYYLEARSLSNYQAGALQVFGWLVGLEGLLMLIGLWYLVKSVFGFGEEVHQGGGGHH